MSSRREINLALRRIVIRLVFSTLARVPLSILLGGKLILELKFLLDSLEGLVFRKR